MIATLFYNPVSLPAGALLWLLPPLCLAVAIVYKTIRTHNLRRLWLEVCVLFVIMMAALAALMVAGYVLIK